MPNSHTNSAKKKKFSRKQMPCSWNQFALLSACARAHHFKNLLIKMLCSPRPALVIFSGAAFLPCQVKLGRFPRCARSVRVPFRSAINKFIVHFNKEKELELELHCACPCEDLLCAKQCAIGWRGSFFITPLRMQLKAEDYRNSFPLVRGEKKKS